VSGKAVYVQTCSVPGDMPYPMLDKLWDAMRAKLPAEGLDPELHQRLLKDSPAKGWVTLVLEGTGPVGLQMTAGEPGGVGISAGGSEDGSGALDGLAGHPEPEPVGLCAVFWGSHGCSLPRGHERADRHECADLGEDGDGPCCQIERELDEVTCEEVWVQRFAEVDIAGTFLGWSADPYPGNPFGEDLAPELVVGQEEVDALRKAWQEAGKLAVWVEGQGWVKKKPLGG
jgi:hypothetical protein